MCIRDSISAMSKTATSFSFSLFLTPSLIIVLQKGQAAAINLAPVSSASSAPVSYTHLERIATITNHPSFPVNMRVIVKLHDV